MAIDVRMPDGTVIRNVPEGTTKEQLQQKLNASRTIPATPEQIQEVSDRFDDPLMASIEGVDTSALEEKGIIKPGGQNVGQLARQNAPLIGATAASLAFPPLAAPGLAAKLPAAASLLSKSPLLKNFLSNVATKAPAATVAGGVGGGLREAGNEGADIESVFRESVRSGVEMGQAELIGHGVVGVGAKIAKPIAASLSKAQKEILSFAKENKIPLSPSKITNSTISKILEGGSDVILGGKLVGTVLRRKLMTRFNQMTADLVKGQGKLLGNSVVGPQAKAEFRSVLSSTESQAKALSTNFLRSVPVEKVKASNFKKLLTNIGKQAKSPSMKRFVQNELAQFGRTSIKTAENLETSMRQIASVRPKGTDRKFMTEMRAAIVEDFRKSGADMDLLKKANDFFRQKQALLSSGSAKRLAGVGGGHHGPSELADAAVTREIFKSGNETFVEQLQKELTPETWEALKVQNIANLIKGQTREIQGGFGLKFLDGSKLGTILDNNKKIFIKVYGEQTFKSLENLAKLAEAGKSEVGQLALGNPAAVFRFATSLATVGGAAAGPLVGVALPQGGSAAIAHSLISPNGLLKNWLTTGLSAGQLGDKAIAEGVKLSIRNTKDTEN